MKYIHKLVLSIFIFILLPIITFLFITSRTSVFFGFRTFNVLTGSMEPTIHVGSMVFTSPAGIYAIGDIITFQRGDVSITHRIVSIKNNQFETKGDANKATDPQKVNRNDIIGKDVFIVPFFGKFITFIKTIPGFILFIILPTLLFIFFEAKTIKEEWEKEIEKKVLKNMKESAHV